MPTIFFPAREVSPLYNHPLSMIGFVLAILLPGAWLLYLMSSFVANYRHGVKMDLPIVTSLINPLSPFWMISHKFLGPVCRALPSSLASFIGYDRTGWEYHMQLKLHRELGDAWTFVSTGKNQLMIADREAIEEVFSRRQDFQKPVFLYRRWEDLKFREIFFLADPGENRIAGNIWFKCGYGIFQCICSMGGKTADDCMNRLKDTSGSVIERSQRHRSMKRTVISCGSSPFSKLSRC